MRMPEPSSLSFPPTPAGQQVAAWFHVFNTGDFAAMRHFVAHQYAPTTRYTDSSLVQYPGESVTEGLWAVKLYSANRGLIPHRVTYATADTLGILAQERYSMDTGWIELRCQVAPAPPHPFITWSIQPVAPPERHASPPIARAADSMPNLDRYLQHLLAADLFSGVVLVAKDGIPLVRHASGFAHKGLQVPNQLDTRFCVASLMKMFTAVALLQCIEQGKASVHDPLRKYVADCPRSVTDRVTLHHLLTHTSGLGNDMWPSAPAFFATKDHLRTIADWLPLVKDAPIFFDPGTRWSYSNIGYLLLGAVIEQLTGQDYFDYLRTQVYHPAGMHHTDAYDLDSDEAGIHRALGYTQQGLTGPFALRPQRNILSMSVVKGSPHGHGGGYSTVTDLLQFATALDQYHVLAPRSTELLLDPKVATGRRADEHYAYGFFIEHVRGHRIIGHGGSLAGVNAWFDMYPDLHYTVAVLANYDWPAAQRIGKKVRQILTQVDE